MNKITSSETHLCGQLLIKDSKVITDSVSERIEYLKTSVLKKVSTSEDGWSTLYKDPEDGRLWEATYASSDSHGGGALELKFLKKDEAIKIFNIKL
ncbi:MAG: hypothetical protein HRT37_12440 [Alteromonadaceae bacterium]|nr:hypothetical protein [Alteromonadaceae bacterium]